MVFVPVVSRQSSVTSHQSPVTSHQSPVTRNLNLARFINGAAALPLALLLLSRTVRGQELEPRAYAANPVNVGFALAAFGQSRGDVLLDPTVPITDVIAKLESLTLGGGGTFALFGRTASVSALLPYAWGTISGTAVKLRAPSSVRGWPTGDFASRLIWLGTRSSRWQHLYSGGREPS
jgi:hypothetical protein